MSSKQNLFEILYYYIKISKPEKPHELIEKSMKLLEELFYITDKNDIMIKIRHCVSVFISNNPKFGRKYGRFFTDVLSF